MSFPMNQKELLKLLKKRGVATFKQESFVQAVNRGQIPFHYDTPDGKPAKGYKKFYYYSEVAEAIKKAGIGKPKPSKSTKDDFDNLPNPKPNQTPIEYGEVAVKELGDKATITDANLYKTIYQGKLEKLKYEKEVGSVIERSIVEDKAFIVARTIRDKILTIPERLSNELASIDNAHKIKEILFKEFSILLEGFSESSFINFK